MDIKVKNCCPKCSQPYFIDALRPLKGRIPLLLPCSHSACEICVRNVVKFSEPLQCQLCEQAVELSPEQSEKVVAPGNGLWEIFPVNVYSLGELALQFTLEGSQHPEVNQWNAYIDLKEIILSSDENVGQCNECKNVTRTKCTQCDTVYCDACFHKVHGAFQSLKMHTKESIGIKFLSSMCPSHSDKTQDYYCETCRKPLCVDCMFLGEKTCSTHKMMSMKEKNACSLEKLKDFKEPIDETYRRLTKTAVDIGNKLHSIMTDKEASSDVDILAKAIKQHYSKLHGFIQKLENKKLQAIKQMTLVDKNSLENAKEEVTKNIKAAKTLLNKLEFVFNNNEAKVNVSELIKACEGILNSAWYLHKPERKTETPALKLNSEVFSVLEEHLQMEEDSATGYTLLPGSELSPEDLPPAPTRPVYPPEVTRDVRESEAEPKKQAPVQKKTRDKRPPSIDAMPRFRPKCNSVSSNSLCSEESASIKRNTKKNSIQDVTPKTLEEGSQEMVYVIHINSPSDFYTQRICFANHLREMKKEFNKASSYPKPSTSQASQGSLLLAYCKVNSQFQRCRIISINKDDPKHTNYYVFYIDCGQTEYVTINELRMLPKFACQLPGLALHCSLANVQPLGGDWDQADSLLMHHIVSNKQSVMYVRRLLGETNLGPAIECDITTYDDHVNLARALVFHNRARLLDHNLKYHKVDVLDQPQLLYNSDMRKGSTEEVIITHIVSPDKFFVRKTYLQEQYDKLCADMEETYSLKDKSCTVYCPEAEMAPCAGSVVACSVEACAEEVDGGGWRRGVVTKMLGRGRVVLNLPDSGHELDLHYSNLRTLKQKFFVVKALAVECHLGKISPNNKKWSKEAVLLMQRHTRRALHALVLEPPTHRSSMAVLLYDRNDPDDMLCINQELIKAKCAVNIGALTFEHPELNKTVHDKVPKPKKPQPPKPKPEVSILKKENLKRLIKEEDLQVKLDKGPAKLEVKILSSQTPSQIYLSFVSYKDTLTALFNQLQIYYDDAEHKTKDDWKPEDRCCVLHNKSKTWRRAAILEIDGEKARIFYTDFAVVDEVKLTDLRPLAEEFLAIRDGAFKCHLSGIMSAGGSEWPGISCEYLNDEIEKYQRFFITKKGSTKDKSLPVELWVYHVTPGGALDADRGEWRLLNAKLVKQGLAIPNREECGEDTTEDTLSLLPPTTPTGSVGEWAQVRAPADADTAASLVPPDHSDSGSDYASPDPSTSPAAPPTHAWLPAKPITEELFVAVPTFVDNNGVIYLHQVCHDDTLDIIVKSLNAQFKDSAYHRTKWSVGESCAARYGLDKCYYRGLIQEVREDASCLVKFVDYGNVEVCDLKHMRRTTLTSRIPIVATQCTLAGINYVAGNRKLAAIEYTHTLITEKECEVKVVGKDEDFLKIELKISNQDISELLVDMHFASYVDPEYRPSIKFNESTDLDSGPDYIIDDDDSDTSEQLAVAPARVDWNRMLEDEEDAADEEDFFTYPPPRAPADTFECSVASIEQYTKLQLLPVRGDPEAARALEGILAEVQAEGRGERGSRRRPRLGRARPGQACIALYGRDGVWFRATVLAQEGDTMRLLYVDFGNVAVVAAGEVRAGRRRWSAVAPLALAAELHAVRLGAGARTAEQEARYRDVMLEERTLVARVVASGAALQVELRTAPDQPLLYQQFIDEGMLLYTP